VSHVDGTLEVGMSKGRSVLAALAVIVFASSLCAADDQAGSGRSNAQQPSAATTGSATPTGAAQPLTHKITAYTLPPDLYKKAHDRAGIRFRLALISFV